jgi:hypothetical protein
MNILVVESEFEWNPNLEINWREALSRYNYDLKFKINKEIISDFSPDIIFLDSKIKYQEDNGNIVDKTWQELCDIIYNELNIENVKIFVITGGSMYNSEEARETHDKFSGFLGIIPNAHEDETIKNIDKIIQNYGLNNRIFLPEIERVKKLSNLKHSLMHLLGALDNDLQGLWDEAERHDREGFCLEKWNEFYQIYKDYDWNRVLNDALELIKKELENVKVDLSPDNKDKIDEFLKSINRAGGELTNDLAHDYKKFVVLLKKVNEFLLNIKKNEKDKVYKELKDNNGLNPIHKMFNELDKILEKFI